MIFISQSTFFSPNFPPIELFFLKGIHEVFLLAKVFSGCTFLALSKRFWKLSHPLASLRLYWFFYYSQSPSHSLLGDLFLHLAFLKMLCTPHSSCWDRLFFFFYTRLPPYLQFHIHISSSNLISAKHYLLHLINVVNGNLLYFCF